MRLIDLFIFYLKFYQHNIYVKKVIDYTVFYQRKCKSKFLVCTNHLYNASQLQHKQAACIKWILSIWVEKVYRPHINVLVYTLPESKCVYSVNTNCIATRNKYKATFYLEPTLQLFKLNTLEPFYSVLVHLKLQFICYSKFFFLNLITQYIFKCTVTLLENAFRMGTQQ